MISEDQYRFYKFCLENDRTKSERQKSYFKKCVEKYKLFEEETEYDEEIEYVHDGFNWIDYMEIIFLVLMYVAYSYSF